MLSSVTYNGCIYCLFIVWYNKILSLKQTLLNEVFPVFKIESITDSTYSIEPITIRILNILELFEYFENMIVLVAVSHS